MTEKQQENKKIPEHSAEKEAAQKDTPFDRKATQEAKQLSSGRSAKELEEDARKAEALRTEKFRNHFEILAVISLYIVWAAIVAVGLTWLYHLIAPACWPRLPEEQVGNIQAIVTGGVIAGIASGHMKKRLH
ncbi:hypothetical protein [Aliiroseovarius sp. YM-037]|uniref:hypothetical protein n=1 Tax=Aliiroseovarius sp. YM-037 TaxID=3341728 RepID=UPI003A7FDDB8